MRNVIFVAPFPAETTLRFVRAARTLENVRLLGVVHTPPGGADARLFDGIARIENPLDLRELARAVEGLAQRYGRPHRIMGILEPLQVELAKLREHFGIEGTDVRTADLFRDKARMKDALRAAGLPCARHRLLHGWRDGADFAEEVGFPMVLKPPAGAGCKATWRINSAAELKEALAALSPSQAQPTLAEEFLRGREHSYETITIDGKIRMASMTEYHPTPLEVVEKAWIQWCVLAPREIDGAEMAEVHRLGAQTVAALGLKTGMTHMEWFRRADGSLAIGEIAARPPGANIVRLTGLCHDTSMYRAWVRAIVDNHFDGPWERKYAAGSAFLRGMGRGRVAGLEGIGALREQLGEMLVEAQLPRIGAPKSDAYEGDGYLLLRHPRTEIVKEALRRVIATARVHYA